MSTQPLLVVGGSVREAQEYCKKEGLGLGKAVILADFYGLHGLSAYQRSFRVRLIGAFHERADATQITNELRIRSAIVEDITGEM